jgi:acyl carrier protein
MVPAALVPLDALPLTSNGKVDRRALPAPALGPAEPPGGSAPPQTETEQTIAAIWQEVLGVEHVGRYDNFFDLGGHSLLAARLVARMREAVGADLALRNMFGAPTVAGLAELIDARTVAAGPSVEPRSDVREEIEL